MNSTFEECETLRLESEDAVRDAKTRERENKRLKQLTSDLGRQVQVSRSSVYTIVECYMV